MKPPRFTYFDPHTLPEALDLLQAHGTDAKVLAGGQSLVPMLNMRLARPAVLVDVNRLPGLAYIRDAGTYLAIGALTRHRQVEKSPLVAARCPLLSEAIRWVGHVQIRNRGTMGGSIAHADPGAELPAVVAALGGRIVLAGAGGDRREVTPDNFFLGWFMTSLQPGEMVVEVRVPTAPPHSGQAFVELARRSGDFALCGVAAHVELDDAGRVQDARMALIGVGPGPIVPEVAGVLAGERPGAAALAAAADRARAAAEPEDDVHATADYRRHLAGVLARRALEQALARAGGPAAAAGGAGA